MDGLLKLHAAGKTQKDLTRKKRENVLLDDINTAQQ